MVAGDSVSLDRALAAGTLEIIPAEHLPAFATATSFFLSLDPTVDSLVSHILQLFNQFGVMRNPVDDMDIQETAQTLAGKIRAFKTPSYVVFVGTSPETCSTVDAGRVDYFGKAPIAPDLFG